MELYRLTKSKYKNDLSGTGAFLAGGRWNNKGTYLLYIAASRSLAVVEALAHLVTAKNAEPYSMLVLYVPDDVGIAVQTNSTLKSNWKTDLSYTQALVDEWAKNNATLLLQVPSAIISKEYNFLLNPLHPQANKVKILEFEPFSLDLRLKNE